MAIPDFLQKFVNTVEPEPPEPLHLASTAVPLSEGKGPVRVYSRILDTEVCVIPDDWEQEMDAPSYTHSELERLNQFNVSAEELRDIHRIREELGGEIVDPEDGILEKDWKARVQRRLDQLFKKYRHSPAPTRDEEERSNYVYTAPEAEGWSTHRWGQPEPVGRGIDEAAAVEDLYLKESKDGEEK